MNQTADMSGAIDALSSRFLADYPRDASRFLEQMPEAEVVQLLAELPAEVATPIWHHLSPGLSCMILPLLPDDAVKSVITELERGKAVRLLGAVEEEFRDHCLTLVDPAVAEELRTMLSYPLGTAGRLMDTQVLALHGHVSVAEALRLVRRRRARRFRYLKIVDEENLLNALVDVRDLALSDPARSLDDISQPLTAVAQALDPREEVVDKLEQFDLEELPVIDLDGHLLGVIRHAELIQALKRDATIDIQTMVGASKDERALSSSWLAVRKRMPWLQVNLLTAFLAASVVGIFEDTIAKVTALAILLPVVAGQSGNAGAQALAVTMRGLALREIRIADWFRVMRKEVNAGFWNGLSIAITCSVGVLLWSNSLGLVAVIAASMVISMVMAGVAGALVPIVLARLKQDPAVASSIILTTVTDVAGFFSFLGIATLLMGMLT